MEKNEKALAGLWRIFEEPKLKRNSKEEVRLNNIYKEEAEFLLNKYGPEGAYNLAQKLINCANKDITEGMKQLNF